MCTAKGMLRTSFGCNVTTGVDTEIQRPVPVIASPGLANSLPVLLLVRPSVASTWAWTACEFVFVTVRVCVNDASPLPVSKYQPPGARLDPGAGFAPIASEDLPTACAGSAHVPNAMAAVAVTTTARVIVRIPFASRGFGVVSVLRVGPAARTGPTHTSLSAVRAPSPG